MAQGRSSFFRGVSIAAVVVISAIGVAAAIFVATWLGGPPNVSDVTAAARKKPQLLAAQLTPQRVEGVGFPDWSRWGWKPVGGRVDDLEGGRDAVSLRYEKGGSTIAYSIVEGPADVNLDDGAYQEFKRHPPGGDVELTLARQPAVAAPDRPTAAEQPTEYTGRTDDVDYASYAGDGTGGASANPIVIKRSFMDHTVILTAWPASEKLLDEAMDMALRTAKS